jgi:hypothetical protein
MDKTEQKGNYKGIVAAISEKKWGKSFRLDGKDVWFTISKKVIDDGNIDDFEKGDMISFEYNFVKNDKGERIFVNKLKCLAERRPVIEEEPPDFLDDVPSPEEDPWDKEPIVPKDKTNGAAPIFSATDILISRQVAVKSACDFYKNQPNMVEPEEILRYAEAFEAFILRKK